jgi:SnoaL-like domain
LKDFAPDAAWDAVPLGQSFQGAAAIRSFLADWRSTYEEYEIEPQEIRDLGNGVVLAVVSQITRPVGSTTRTRMREAWAFVFVWIDGTVVRAAANSDIVQARAVAERLAEERG